MVLQDDSTTVLLVGGGAGSGKSFTCLVKALKYVKDPAARVLIIRESQPVLKIPGGLIDESSSIYGHFGAVYKIQPMEWVFPNGATIKFAAMPDNMAKWQGLQYTAALVDEAAGFTQEQILFLLSRMRSPKYKGHLSLTMTVNPDKNSFLFDWLQYCLDPDTGIPKEGTEDITRYFVNLNGKMLWGNSIAELYKEHGAGYILGKNFNPTSFRFIPMTIYDNPVLMKANPGYLASLLAQPRVNQQRFLHGSWTARPEGSSYFDRSWIKFVDYPPVNPMAVVRSWDLAASVPSEVNKDPDYTVGLKMSRDKMGMYYIEDVHRFRKLSDGVIKEIAATGHLDGEQVKVTIPCDPGAGGKMANMFMSRTLAEQGVATKSISTTGHTGKVNNFLPFCSLAEGGSVCIVKGDWNDDYLTELEFFTGRRTGHDDQVDATSSAFNALARQVVVPTFRIPSMEMPSAIPKLA